MRVPISLSLILSQVKAFIYAKPRVTSATSTDNRIQGMPRCKSTDSIMRMEEMESSTLDSPKEPEMKMDKPVNPHVEMFLEVTPLVVLVGLVSLGHN